MFGRRNETAEASKAAWRDDRAAEQLWSPTAAKTRKSIEQLLLERGHITEEQLTQAKTVQSQTPGKSLTQVLLTMNAASDAQILSALAETQGLPFESPDKAQMDNDAFNLLGADYVRKQLALPLRFEEGSLVVAMCDPTNVFLIDEIK